MSHELRTPLNAIAGYVDLLEAGVEGPVSEGQRRYLDRVKRAQGLLLRRIDEMLNFAKVDSGTLTYLLTDVPVDETLSELTALIQPLMVQRDLTLDYDPPPFRVIARADREKCEQIILNVLSNAMKFTDRGGRVGVSCRSTEGWVEVLVSDTGVGIPSDKLRSIFEPFIQVDSSLTRQRHGTGLGLAISRQLARGMGGEVTATSTPAVGSTFTLRLPSSGDGKDRPATALDVETMTSAQDAPS
jgi:signal transduction histidine kinase